MRNMIALSKHFLKAAIWLAAALGLAACSLTGAPDAEIEGAPGEYVFTEGETAYPGLYRQAARHLATGEYDEAEALYRDLIDKEPQNSNGYIGLATSLHLQGNYEAAQAAYEQALQISPKSVAALVGLGSALSAQGEYAAAEQHYAAALELNPADPNAHWGMALALQRQGRLEEVREHLERVIELSPGTSLAESASEMLQALDVGGESP